MTLRVNQEKQRGILVVDFGSQYSRLIARRVRELNRYCEIVSPDSKEEATSIDIDGVILSGGPSSVYDEGAPSIPEWIKKIDVPFLGICYGMQEMIHEAGGKVQRSDKREYGRANIKSTADHPIMKNLESNLEVWMSHSDRVESLPDGFSVIAESENCKNAVIARGLKFIGLQFHPEVSHTPQGVKILENYLEEICRCPKEWVPEKFVKKAIRDIKEKVGNQKVICALSGGVDSSVVAMLLYKAIGEKLTCIFVDNGLMRKDEPERIISTFEKKLGSSFMFVDAADEFLSALENITDPEQKRKIIGTKFIEVFERAAESIGEVRFLAQGTLYSDVVESKTPGMNASDRIKSHHNVGGLPENMRMELVEPLRFMFKDEARLAGLELGLENEIVNRQPFPGPGLAIRIIGAVDREKLEIIREADWIVINEIKKNNLYEKLWQTFAVLTNIQTVGVMGDKRTYSYVVALRCVESIDAMTADWAELPAELLKTLSTRIVNEVSKVNRVVYDITSKPPGTIEWE